MDFADLEGYKESLGGTFRFRFANKSRIVAFLRSNTEYITLVYKETQKNAGVRDKYTIQLIIGCSFGYYNLDIKRTKRAMVLKRSIGTCYQLRSVM